MVAVSRSLVLRTLLLWAALETLAAWQVRAADGSPLVLSWLRALLEPVAWFAGRGGDLAGDVGRGAGDLRRVVVDNRQLRLELEALRARDLLLSEDLAAQRELRLLARDSALFSANAIAARCIFRDLPAGTMEVRTATEVQVRRDAPAVTAGGLVGRVVRSEGRRHWLQLITHQAAAAAVQTPDAEVQGLVLGGGGTLSVAYVPRQARLERETVLLSSGGDGIFPPGIPTAKVVRIRETSEPFLEVGAVPTADLQSVRVVLLLPEWSRRGG